MRRLAVLLSAFVLALIAAAPNLLHAKPAFALPPGCEVQGDVMDQYYNDWNGYAVGYTNDSQPPGFHYVNVHLWAFRESHDPGTGVPHCYRAYFAATNLQDSSWGNLTVHLHAQICGRPVDYHFFNNTQAGPWLDYATQQQWGDVTNIADGVRLPNPSGEWRLLYFADYGIFPIENGCLPQAETTDTSAGNPTWSIPRSAGANTFISSPPAAWWCTMGPSNIQCYDWI